MRGTIRVLVICALAACGNPSRNGDNGNGHPDGGADCTMDGAHRCDGSSYETCVGGQWMSAIDCPAFCDQSLGCIECVPGERFCKDGDVWQCADDGTAGSQVEQCTGINVCAGGTCVDACADAAVNKSYIGCDYWAVDLDNAIEVWGGSNGLCGQGSPVTLNVCYAMQGGGTYAGLCDPQDDGTAPHTCPGNTTCQAKLVCASDAQHGVFAVVISNPQSKDAHVTITGPNGTQIMKTVTAGQVLPIAMQAAGTNIPDQSVDGTGKFKKGYRVQSDVPIVAYQFNPLDNSSAVFANDASLLIPAATFDTDYYVMTMPTLDRRPTAHPYYGYLTVIAWQDGTQISVTPSAAIVPSQTQSAIAAGATANFTLDAFEVLQLEASGTGDLTGTHITSSNMRSFGVFGGHEAKQLADPGLKSPDNKYPYGPGFADHLEEMMFPSSTWGKTFAIARSQQRFNSTDVLRIMAQMPGTNVTFTPALTAPPATPTATPAPVTGTCGVLDPGKFCDVYIAGDTEIAADKPVLVAHFIESTSWLSNSNAVIPGATGDPSMALATPTEQFRKEYTILVPSAYAENYASIEAAATGGVTVQRITPSPGSIPVTLTQFGTHRAARVALTAGQYKITCADGCGISVYGYSPGVSYMFAGGLDLKPIVIF